MKNMMKFAGAAVVALALAQSGQANTINGSIGFTGGVTTDSSSMGTATEVTSWITPEVTLDSGDFGSIANNTPVLFSSAVWKFDGSTTPIDNFWSVGGFTFDLLSSSIVSQGGGGVYVNGSGQVSNDGGLTWTTMSWSFSSQDPVAGTNPDTWTFSASANTFSTIPDGGATVILLGITLSGVAFLRKRLKA